MAINKRERTILVLAFITVFLDTLNHALIVPILPYLADELDSTSMQEGLLFSAYSVMQLISLLIMGPGSDSFGRRPFLLLSLFGSCFGSLFQGMSNTMWPLIFWRAFTGLFAGSQILVQAVVADVTVAEDRNKYLSRLDACISFAYIVGPAIGGILAQVSNHFPMYVAGIVSGIAMIIALIFLKESNPKILKEKELKAKKAKQSEVNKCDIHTEAKEKHKKLKLEIKLKSKSKSESELKVKVKVTSTMVLCFIVEFCNKWVISAFDSRYGIYVKDKWQINSLTYSIIVIIQSFLCFVLQAFAYPWVTKYICIPNLAAIGLFTQLISYILMGAISNVYGNIMASYLLWIGYCCSSPTSASIISTTTNPDYQGTVLSWNNLFCSFSLIVGPLVLSAIYTRDSESIYYFSSVFGFIGFCIMLYVSTWTNAKIIGKKSLYNGDSKSIELSELNGEKTSEETVVIPQIAEITLTIPETERNSVNAPQTVGNTVDVPQTKENSVHVPQTEESTVSVPQTEGNSVNAPQTEEKITQVQSQEKDNPQV